MKDIAIQLIPYVFLYIGLYLIGRKNKYGWLFDVMATILFFIITVSMQAYGFALAQIPLFVLTVRGFINFSK